MTDRDVQREIEANERRARDEEDVGVDEDVLADEAQPTTEPGLLRGLLNLGDENDATRDEEFRDQRKTDESTA
jgi:hypothetical protein